MNVPISDLDAASETLGVFMAPRPAIASEPYNPELSWGATDFSQVVSIPTYTSAPVSPLTRLRALLACMSPELPASIRDGLGRQFAFLCEAHEDEVEGDEIVVPDPDSFAVMLRFMVDQDPAHMPSLTISSRGYTLASWFNTTLGKFTIEFEPDGRAQFRYLDNANGAIALRKGTLEHTRDALPQGLRL